jgi:hypothetical protein
MIMFGGIKYMSTDAFSGKSEARGTIENAIWGLVLAISAWLILNTINPNLTNFNLSIPVQPIAPPSAAPGTGGGTAMTPTEIAADAAVRNSLPSGVTAAGPCLNGGTTGCVNLNGISSRVISGVGALQVACKCNVVITGGTEGGHTSHSGGNTIDISPSADINTAIAGKAILKSCGGYTGTGAYNGAYLWEAKGATCGGQFPSSADHWHVQF